ncbi:cellulose binding domain-containing protein [Micromonospora echinofusca]|uniref:Cellulose-binding protein n=1 Tax=Micromonospora echinofusca TaxID=47858 RepID=A0ABS3VW64_MICEH|nr:cellulose binding domain-containing protein [Micromonospora echinofusca]MBO4208663.1 cellulose-binding protein [Micromonospora echinofusca]
MHLFPSRRASGPGARRSVPSPVIPSTDPGVRRSTRTPLPRSTPARVRRSALAALVAGAVAALLVSQLPARALVPGDPPAPVTGNATYFDSLGSPYGGCGLPQGELDSPHFLALNVYDTPGDYTSYPPRPIPPSMADKIGLWNNGLNCGRYIRVSIGDFCTGLNDGAPGQPFCRNGSWVPDAYNGATLTMLVADSCGDGNAWCRDDRYHLDLATASLNQFVKNGAPVGDLYPDHWGNRRIQWEFVPAPNYSGDIRIGFLQGAQRHWPAIAVSHLANGIHGVEYLSNGSWQPAQMNSDMGQSYILGATVPGGTDFQIRVRDAAGTLVNNGRVYRFSLPASCGDRCAAAYTQVSYTTSDGSGPTTGPSPTVDPSPSATASPTPTGTPAGGCSASYAVTGSWSGGYQAEITVRNTGSSAIGGWSTVLSFPGSQQVANYWNATVTQSGQRVSATNVGYNGVLAPGGTTTWGMVVNGADQPPGGLTCSVR